MYEDQFQAKSLNSTAQTALEEIDPYHVYHYFLADKSVFLNFLQSLVKKDWVHQINPTTLAPLKSTAIQWAGRRPELVYQMKLKDRAQDLYVLLYIQSSFDNTLPFELLSGTVDLWKAVCTDQAGPSAVKTMAIPGKGVTAAGFLPLVLPIVLYHGKERWTASTNIRDVFESAQGLIPPGIETCLPNFEYILVDVTSYSVEDLNKLPGLLNLIIQLEQSYTIIRDNPNLQDVGGMIDRFNPDDFQTFKNWFMVHICSYLSQLFH